jgi:hypothetical protein
LKLFGRVLLLLIAVYFMYQGYSTYTFSARSYDGSMGIYKFSWLFIPATDYHLHTYGTVFISIGLLIALTPLVLHRLSLKRNKST